MSVLFITHDLGVIAEIADDVAVMFQGKVVEYGKVLDIFEQPTASLHEGPPRLQAAAGRRSTRSCRPSPISWRSIGDGDPLQDRREADDARAARAAHDARAAAGCLHPKTRAARHRPSVGRRQARPGHDDGPRGADAAPFGARSQGPFSDPQGDLPAHGRPRQGGRWHQLRRLSRPDARPRRRIGLRQDDRRPGHPAADRARCRPRGLRRRRSGDARRRRPAARCAASCKSSFRTPTAA